MNPQTKELVLRLIDDKRESLAHARQLASAQLGRAHPQVGEISVELEAVERARREVSNVQARLAGGESSDSASLQGARPLI